VTGGARRRLRLRPDAGGRHYVEVERDVLFLANGGLGDLMAGAFSCGCRAGTSIRRWSFDAGRRGAVPSYVGHLHRPVALKMVPGVA
jgi:hypothetical protein